MKHLMEGLATMVAAIVVFLIISNFVTSSVITGKLCASIKSNLNRIMPLIRWKLRSYEYAYTELNMGMNHEKCREYKGHTLDRVMMYSEPERKFSGHLTDVGSTLKLDWRVKTCQIRGKLNSLKSKLIAELSRMSNHSGNVERLDGRNLVYSRLWYSPYLNESSAIRQNQGGLSVSCCSYRELKLRPSRVILG